MNQYYVYILTNKSKTLYTGVTNNLQRRVFEHKQKIIPGFTAQYNIDKLVYYEISQDVTTAITREKQIKGWLRNKKVKLIESMNPEWKDLSNEWYDSSTCKDVIKRDSSVVPARAVTPSE
jgi:putative endonuclease